MTNCLKNKAIMSVVVVAVVSAFNTIAMCAPASKTLTLSDSIKIGVSQSSQVRLSEMAVIEAQKNLERVSVDQLLPGVNKNIQDAKDSLELTKMNIQATKDSVASEIEQAYFSVITAQDVVSLRNTALTTAKRQLNETKEKYNHGLASKNDQKNMEDNLAASEYSLLAAKNSLKLSVMKFNRVMGWDLNTTVKLSEKLDFKKVKVDVNAAVKYALANRSDILQAKYTYKRRTEDLTLSSNEFTPLADQEQIRLNLEKARMNLEQVTRDATIAVWDSYYNLINAQNEVDNKTRAIERAKNGVAMADQKYKNGLIRSNDVINAQVEYQNCQIQRLQALNTYRSTLSGFYRTIGKPNPAVAK